MPADALQITGNRPPTAKDSDFVAKTVDKYRHFFCLAKSAKSQTEKRNSAFIINRDESRFALSQCETSLQSNGVSHWLGANLESALHQVPSEGWSIYASQNWVIIGLDKGLSPSRCQVIIKSNDNLSSIRCPGWALSDEKSGKISCFYHKTFLVLPSVTQCHLL